MQGTDNEPLELLGLPDLLLTIILTKTINQSFEFLRVVGRFEPPDFGDWRSLFKCRQASRRFCELVGRGVLLATDAAPLLAAAVWASLRDAIRRQHLACTQEYTLHLRARLLKLADNASSDTEALATREALTEEAAKLTNAPVLQGRLLSTASSLNNYEYVQAQIRKVAEMIYEMNTPQYVEKAIAVSNYFTICMLRSVTSSGLKIPDLREIPQMIVMWAGAGGASGAEEIPYPLQCLCKRWRLAPQQEGLDYLGWDPRLIDDATTIDRLLCSTRRETCICPDCKLNYK